MNNKLKATGCKLWAKKCYNRCSVEYFSFFTIVCYFAWIFLAWGGGDVSKHKNICWENDRKSFHNVEIRNSKAGKILKRS